MNEYEEKQERKRQRYLDRADTAEAKSDSAHNKARQIGDMIPFGQPILVGHHSEKRHRSDVKKINNAMHTSVSESKKADYYRQKAESVGKGGISSDDPDAIKKLKEKLAKLEASQEYMKKINAIYRKFIKKPDTLDEADLPEKSKDLILNFKPTRSWETGLFPSYELQNNNANIGNVKKRIAQLERSAKAEDVPDKEFEGFTVKEEDNRIQFVFPGKPDAEIRSVLKSHAFKWSPSRGAWVRQLTGNGRWNAERVIKLLTGKEDL